MRRVIKEIAMNFTKSGLAGIALILSASAAPPAGAQTAYSTNNASAEPVTRAQVKADLRRLEQAGYDPATRDPYYPDQIQAAEARVSRQNAAPSAEPLAPPPAAP